LQKTGLLDLAVRPEERRGKMPKGIPTRLPDVVAQMALNQFARLDAFNSHRQKLSALYHEKLAGTGIQLPAPDEPETRNIYLRFTLHVPDPATLHHAARAQNIYLGNWYDTVIAPADADLSAVAYTPGQCPVAERQSATSINLPTHPKVTLEDGERVSDLIAKNFSSANLKSAISN
jgi:dTDP-4-amino-4,6-dideoxygalactose transaminase